MDDLFGEVLFRIFGPIVLVFAVVGGIGWGIHSCYQWVTGTGKAPIEEYHAPQPVEKKTLSHKAGTKAKEIGKEFIKGFFE